MNRRSEIRALFLSALAALTLSGQELLLLGPHQLTFNDPAPGRAVAVRYQGNVKKPFTFHSETFAGGDWLRAEMLYNTPMVTPATIWVSIKVNDLPAGTYRGRITVEAESSVPPQVVDVEFVVRPAQTSPVTSELHLYHQVGTPGAPAIDRQAVPLASPFLFLTIITGGPWLQRLTGAIQSLIVRADAAALPPGDYRSVIRDRPFNSVPTNLNAVFVNLHAGEKPVLESVPGRTIETALHPGEKATVRLPFRWSDGDNRDIELSASPAATWLAARLCEQENEPSSVCVDLAADLPEGRYQGSVTFGSEAALNPPLTVPVELTVTTKPVLAAPGITGLTELEFVEGQKTAVLQPGPIEIAVDGRFEADPQQSTPFAVSVASSVAWLTAARGEGNQVLLQADPVSAELGLTAGEYWADVLIKGPGNTLRIPVRATVVRSNRTLSVDLPVVTFPYQPGSSSMPAKVIQVTSPSGPLAFRARTDASWLRVGTTANPNTLELSLEESIVRDLAPGLYEASVRVEGLQTGVGSTAVRVKLNVSPDPLALAHRPLLTFATKRNAASGVETVTFSSTDGSALPVTLTPGADWMQVEPLSGTTPFTVSVRTRPLPEGAYASTITADSGEIVQVRASVTAASPVLLTTNPAEMKIAIEHGQAHPGKYFQMTSSSEARTPVSISTSTVNGGNWLSAGVEWNALANPATEWSAPALASAFLSETATLPPGSYLGTVALLSSVADNSPARMPVTLTVNGSAGPQVTSSPSTVNVTTSQVNTPVTRSIRITGAKAPLQIRTVYVNGSDWLTHTVNAGVIELRMIPTRTGRYMAELLIGSKDNVFMSVPITLDVVP